MRDPTAELAPADANDWPSSKARRLAFGISKERSDEFLDTVAEQLSQQGVRIPESKPRPSSRKLSNNVTLSSKAWRIEVRVRRAVCMTLRPWYARNSGRGVARGVQTGGHGVEIAWYVARYCGLAPDSKRTQPESWRWRRPLLHRSGK